MTKGFGGQFDAAETDLRAAEYIRSRRQAAADALQRMLDDLEERAREFEERGRGHVRAVLAEDGAEDVDGEAAVTVRQLTRHIARHPSDEAQAEIFGRMVEEAGLGEELRMVSWLAGQEPGPAAPRAAPSPQRAPAARQPSSPPRSESRVEARSEPVETPVRRPAPAAGRGGDEFFGIAVPAGKEEVGRSIVADALARAADGGELADSPYINARGRNAWQPELLRVAHAAHLAALSTAEQELGTDGAAGTEDAEVPADGAEADVATDLDATADEAEGGPEIGDAEAAQDEAEPPVEPAAVHAEQAEEEFFGDEAADPVVAADSEAGDGLFAEPLDEDRDDAREITVPLQPAPRPAPSVVQPAVRSGPPPVRPASGPGLMSSNVPPRRPVAPPPPTRR